MIAHVYQRMKERMTFGGIIRPGGVLSQRGTPVLPANYSGLENVQTDVGIGVAVQQPADNWNYTIDDSFQMSADIDFSLAVVFTPTGVPSGILAGIITVRDSPLAGRWNFYYRPDLVRFEIGAVGETGNAIWNIPETIANDGKTHVAVVVRRKNSNPQYQMWLDGVDYGTAGAGGTPTAGNHSLVIGRMESDEAFDEFPAVYHMLGIWKDYALD